MNTDYAELEQRIFSKPVEDGDVLDIYSHWAEKYQVPRHAVKEAVWLLFYTENSPLTVIEEALVKMLPLIRARGAI